MKTLRWLSFLGRRALVFLALAAGALTAHAASGPIKNVVLVHGAFADGSSWSKVITLLQDKGYTVTAVQLPLSSLEQDVAATRRALARQDGPVILVGHSWVSHYRIAGSLAAGGMGKGPHNHRLHFGQPHPPW